MTQQLFILHNKSSLALAECIRNKNFGHLIYTENHEIDEQTITDMAKKSWSDYFYVICADKPYTFDNVDFGYIPPEWDSKYLHIWDDKTIVRLFNKSEVLNNPAMFTDAALSSGNVKIKNILGKFTTPLLDMVFLSYDESYADANYEELKKRFPRLKRVAGVKGIYQAHKVAADQVGTELFYAIDADAKVLPDFDFSYYPNFYDAQSVHVWKSRNPINDLVYGYGGIKLFPTDKLRKYTGSPVDFTTSVSDSFKVMDEVSNITHFNTDPFSTWRSAFRECAKLAAGLIKNQNQEETVHRLNVWCTVGADREFGEFALMGANEGREYGMECINHSEMLGMINDYKWLEERFSS